MLYVFRGSQASCSGAHARRADVGSDEAAERQPTCPIRAGYNWIRTAFAGLPGGSRLLWEAGIYFIKRT